MSRATRHAQHDALRRGRGGDGDVRLGRILGVPVLLTPSWWLGALVIAVAYLPVVQVVLPDVPGYAALGLAVGMAVLLGASVLAHELGHCVVALRLGLPVRRVRLFLLGGVSELSRPALRPRDDALVAAAGPAVSMVLSAMASGGAVAFEPRTVPWLIALQLAVANAVVAVFNMLPGLPLDGGLVLRAAVWSLTGRRDIATRAAAAIGVVVGIALICWGLYSISADVDGAWLRFAVAVLTAWFVLVGAFSALGSPQQPTLPESVPLVGLVQPLLQLSAESPVADALYAAAGRGVLLVRADGVAAGLLDQFIAADLVGRSPLAPASRAAQPVSPECVLLDAELRDDPVGVLERLQSGEDRQFLVVDEHGRATGVLRWADVSAAVATLGETHRW